MARAVCLLVALILALSVSSSAHAATCADFPNQAAAQQAANTDDPDHDGVYCVISPR